MSVSQPCIVMFRESDGKFDIAVSDPTQKLTSLSLRVKGNLKPAAFDEAAKVEINATATTIYYDMTNSCGRTMEASFEIEK